MAGDPKYGSNKVGFSDVISRMNAEEGASLKDLEEKERKLAQAQGVEEKSTRVNTGARDLAVRSMQAQVEAISSLQGALTRETALLNTNTAAWRRAAEARAQATAAARGEAAGIVSPVGTSAAGGRYGATTVGFSDAIVATEGRTSAAQELEQKSAKLQQAEVAASAAAERRSTSRAELDRNALARRQLDALAARKASEQTGVPILSQEAALTGPQSLGRSLGSDIVPYQDPRLPVGLRPSPVGLRRPFLPPPGTGDLGLGTFGPKLATEQQAEAIAVNSRLKSSLAGVGSELAAVNVGWRQSVAETASASQALTRHGALSAEFVQSLARGEVTLREFGSSLTTTIGKFAGWAVAGGLVYGAFEALKRVVSGATETATGVSQLERAGVTGFDKRQAEEGFRRTSSNVNVSIADAANAQFYAARSGFNKSLPENQSAGETVLLAHKLDEVPIQEAARGLGTVRKAFGLNAGQIRQVFNELDVGQLKFNARLQQTLPYLGRSAAAFETAGGSIKGLVAQIVEVTGAVPGGGGGGGSGSAATFFTREPGNLRRPAAQEILRTYGFDPHGPIDALNKSLQEAARTGRTPSGAATTSDVRYRLAEAISGGPALAGRYGIQLINAGLGGRAKEIETELAKAGDAGAEDLHHKLGQFDEELGAVGHAFERVGSEIGSSGVVSAAEDFLAVAKKTGEAIAFLAQPLEGIGKVFSSLPASLQDVLVLGGAAAGASKLGGFGVLERGTDKEFVRNAGRTTSEGLARQRSAVERRAYDLETAKANEQDAVKAKARFAAQAGPELAVLNPESARAKELAIAGGRLDDDILAAKNKSLAAEGRLQSARERQLTLTEDEAIINSKTLSSREKANQLRARGIAAAEAGIANNLPYTTAQGKPGGTALAAREGQLTLFPLSEAGAATAEEIKTQGAVVGGSLDTAAVEVKAGSITLKDALVSAALQIKDGAALALAGGVGAGSVKAGGAEILAGGAAGAGAIGSRISQNLLKSFGIAFLGGAAAEIGGEAVSKFTGSKKAGNLIGGIGQGAAYGAVLGSLAGPEGIAIGGAIGATAGALDQLGVFGGGGKNEKVKTERLKYEKQLIEEKVSANVASIEGQALEFGKELEASVKDESEAAVKAREKIGAIIANLSATQSVFGLGTATGQEAQSKIATTLAQAYLQQFKVGPANVGKASAAYQQSFQAAQKGAEESLKQELPFANTPGQRAHITARALGTFSQARREKDAEAAQVNDELVVARQKEASDRERAAADLVKQKGEGVLHPTVSTGITKAIDADVKAVESLKRTVDKIRGAKAKFDHAVELAELDVLEASVGEDKAVVQGSYAKQLQKAGADPASKRAVERRRISEEARTELPILQKGPAGRKRYEAKQGERDAAYEKLAEEEKQEKAGVYDRRAARELAHLPANATQQAIDAIKKRAAQDKLVFEKAHKGAFTPQQIEEAENSIAETVKSSEGSSESEASTVVQGRGALRQAQDAGNSVAQAKDAAQTAHELLGLAKNEGERLSAMADIINAANQLQQALQTKTRELGELKESTELNPLEKDKTHLANLHKLLKTATPDEKPGLHKDINDTINRTNEDKLSEFEEETKRLLTLEQIVPEQAAQRIHEFLKKNRKKLSKRAIRQLEEEAFQDENQQGGTDFAVTNVPQPTVLGAGRLTLDNRLRASEAARGRALPQILSSRAQPLSGSGSAAAVAANYTHLLSPQLHQTNHISIVVTGGRPGQVVGELERAFRTTTKSQLRSARLVS